MVAKPDEADGTNGSLQSEFASDQGVVGLAKFGLGSSKEASQWQPQCKRKRARSQKEPARKTHVFIPLNFCKGGTCSERSVLRLTWSALLFFGRGFGKASDLPTEENESRHLSGRAVGSIERGRSVRLKDPRLRSWSRESPVGSSSASAKSAGHLSRSKSPDGRTRRRRRRTSDSCMTKAPAQWNSQSSSLLLGAIHLQFCLVL